MIALFFTAVRLAVLSAFLQIRKLSHLNLSDGLKVTARSDWTGTRAQVVKHASSPSSPILVSWQELVGRFMMVLLPHELHI